MDLLRILRIVPVVVAFGCQDTASFAGPYGDCDSYAVGQPNYGNCEDPVTVMPYGNTSKLVSDFCPKTCGICDTLLTSSPTTSPTSSSAPTASPTKTKPDVNYPLVCEDSDDFNVGFGDCSAYEEANCENNILCPRYFCRQDGANYYCPKACGTCLKDDPNFFSAYGNCESYETAANKPNCQADLGLFSPYKNTTAWDACPVTCENYIPKPLPPVEIQDCPAFDNPTFTSSQGLTCVDYNEDKCIGNPDCAFYYCEADGASKLENCPIACQTCNGCILEDPSVCDGKCMDSDDPVQCKAGIKGQVCWCDPSCTINNDCCPDRANYCKNNARARPTEDP